MATLLVLPDTYAIEADSCVMFVKLAEKGHFRTLQDAQIDRSLCVLSRELVDAIAKKDLRKERACMAAAEEIGREFKRRWPKRPMREVTGKC